MGLILRQSLNRPLTHEELDNNLIYLDINEWKLQSYEKGMWCYIKGVDNIYALYLCETTHIKNIYPGGVFTEVVGSVRLWRPFTGGSGTGTTFFQNALPTTAGNLEGIPAGSTFVIPHTMQEMWDLLLYPYQQPYLTSFSFSSPSGILEIGTSFDEATAVWTTANSENVVPNSLSISGYNLLTETGLPANGNTILSFTSPVERSTAGTRTWIISGINTKSGTFSRTFNLSWYWRFYWGVSSGSTLNESEIKALSHNDLLSGFYGNYTYTEDGYKYLCIPDAICSSSVFPANFWDFDLGLQMAMTDEYPESDNDNSSYYLIDITNNGITAPYRVYRTKWEIGSIIIVVA